MINPKLIELLVCPLCKGKLLLNHDSEELICRFDKLAYPINDDIPVMLESKARELPVAELDALKG